MTRLQHRGFEIPLVACCGYGGTYNNGGCGGKFPVNRSQIFVGSCEHLKINWNEIHYTKAANKFVFDQISTGAFSYPLVPLKMACRNI
ncbi:esterase [Quercus suber]|uniref:Esterase n=1 Tax=Quercus suber TaxID=58331 RepID=A0AAW0KJM0_QUESU